MSRLEGRARTNGGGLGDGRATQQANGVATPKPSTRLWHPYSDMSAVAGHELMIERAEGVWLWDTDGRRYLDATASLWYCSIGHGRQRMADAIAGQICQLDAYSIFGDLTNLPAYELAERLADLAPMDDARVLLTTGGGDGIETAAKLARLYWAAQGKPRRTHIIGRAEGFHGVFGFGTSLGGIEGNRAGFGPLMPEVTQVAHDSLAALEAEIQRVGAERVAAFCFEPVIGAGGVLHPPDGYIRGIADICAQHGVLLICDSVVCGFGRLGTWYGIERFEVQPDMIVIAKGVTSGYLPLGGVVVAGHVAEPLWSGATHRLFRHGTTYAGHPTCCVAALTNIDIIEEERLLERSRDLEQRLDSELRPLAEHPDVAAVRVGLGFMAAVELEQAVLDHDGGAVAALAGRLRERGVLVRPLGRSIALSPPLICEQAQIELIGAAIRATLQEPSQRG
jgi:putrescine---pyruvate transaminase